MVEKQGVLMDCVEHDTCSNAMRCEDESVIKAKGKVEKNLRH